MLNEILALTNCLKSSNILQKYLLSPTLFYSFVVVAYGGDSVLPFPDLDSFKETETTRDKDVKEVYATGFPVLFPFLRRPSGAMLMAN